MKNGPPPNRLKRKKQWLKPLHLLNPRLLKSQLSRSPISTRPLTLLRLLNLRLLDCSFTNRPLQPCRYPLTLRFAPNRIRARAKLTSPQSGKTKFLTDQKLPSRKKLRWPTQMRRMRTPKQSLKQLKRFDSICPTPWPNRPEWFLPSWRS